MYPFKLFSIIAIIAVFSFSCNNADDDISIEFDYQLYISIVSSGQNITSNFNIDSTEFAPLGCIQPVDAIRPLEHLDTALVYRVYSPCCVVGLDDRQVIFYDGSLNPIDTFHVSLEYTDSTMVSSNCKIVEVYTNSNSEIELVDGKIYWTIFE